MADAFKGLTIRLGADVRPLNSALSSVNKSASAAQKQLNALSRALKGDAQNAALLGSRAELVEDKMKLMARSANLVGIAIRQAGQEQVSFSSSIGIASGKMSVVAKNVKDVFSQTQRLRAEETHINAELQHIYDAAKKVYAQTLLQQKAVKTADEATVAADKHIKSLQRHLTEGGDAAEKARSEMYKLLQAASKTKEVIAAFNLDKASSASSRLWYDWVKLREASKRVGQDLKTINGVQGFRVMMVQAQVMRSELKQVAREAVSAKTALYALSASNGLAKSVERVRSLDNVLESVTNDAREMREVMKAIPYNLDAATERARAMKAQEEVLVEKTKKIQAVLTEIRSNPAFNEQKARTMNAAYAVDRLEDEYASLEADMKMAEAKQESLTEEMKEFGRTKILAPGRSMKQLKEEIRQTEARMTELRSKIAAVDGKLQDAAMYQEFQKMHRELLKVSADLTTLQAKASVFSRINNAALAATRALRTMGYGLYSTITPALMMAGRYAIQAAKDIDSAYRDMRKTVNGTEEQFEHLRQAALEFSTTHVTSAQQILEIESVGGQLGIAAENLEGFSRVVSNLDIATNMDAETIAENLGQLSNIMWDIKKHKDDPVAYQQAITSFSDSLVRLGNNSAAQEDKIMKVMMRIASLGSISHFTTDQLLAISTAIAATGQGAEAAGTAVARTFSQIENAVGVGGETLQQWANVAQMSAADFAEAWNNDPIRAFQAFINGLKAIDDAGGSVDNTLRGLKINSVRQKQALEGLTTTTDVLAESLRMSADAWNGEATYIHGAFEKAGDAAREAERKSEGFSGTLGKMTNNAKYLAMELATGAEPILKNLGDAFLSLKDTISGMSQESKTNIIMLATGIAALGPAAVGLGAVTNVFAQFIGFLGKQAKMQLFTNGLFAINSGVHGVAAAGINASSALGKFSAAISGLTLGKTLVGIAAIASLAEILKTVYDRFMTTKKATTEFSDAIGYMPSIGHTWERVVALSDGMADLSVNMYDVIKRNAELADSIKSKNREAQTEIDLLEDARDTISQYNGKANLSAAELGKLQAAIDLVNEKCKTQYQLVDGVNGVIRDENGALVESVDSIYKYIRAKQLQVEAEAAEANYNAAREQHLENIKALASAQRDYDLALDEMQDPAKYGMSAENAAAHFRSAQENLSAATQMSENTSKVMERSAARLGQITSGQSFLNSNWEGTFNAYFEDAGEAFEDFCTAVNDAGVSIEDLNNLSLEQILSIASGWRDGTHTITSLLDEAGLKVNSFYSVVENAMAAAGLDMESFANSFGISATDFIRYLQSMGVSASDMANALNGDFAGLLEQSGGNLDTLIQLIIKLNETPAEVKIDTSQADAALDGVESEGEAYAEEDYEAEASLDASDAEDEWNDLGDTADSYDGSTYTATADLDTSAAVTKLDSLMQRLRDYANTHVEASASVTENAAGGIYRYGIPANASGGINGIITRATLTNVGWVGENGDEALFHMRHAGGAIIPLSNRQHVRPFAQAVAAEMYPYTGYQKPTTEYNIYFDNARLNDDAGIRNAAMGLLYELSLKGAI